MAPLVAAEVMAAAATAVAVAGALEVKVLDAEVAEDVLAIDETAEAREEEAALEAATMVARGAAGEVVEVAMALICWADDANALTTALEVDLAEDFLDEAEALALMVEWADLCLVVVVDLLLGFVVAVVVLDLVVVFLVVVVLLLLVDFLAEAFVVECFLLEVLVVAAFLLDDADFLTDVAEWALELEPDTAPAPALIVNKGDWFPVDPSVRR